MKKTIVYKAPYMGQDLPGGFSYGEGLEDQTYEEGRWNLYGVKRKVIINLNNGHQETIEEGEIKEISVSEDELPLLQKYCDSIKGLMIVK